MDLQEDTQRVVFGRLATWLRMFETGHLAECRVVTRGHIPKLQSLRISETFPNFQHISSVGSMFFLQTSQKKHNVFIHVFQPEIVRCFHPSEAEIRLRPAPRSRVRGLGLRGGHGGAAGEAWGTQRRGAVAKEGSASDGRADFSTSDGAKVSSKSSRFPEILTSQLREMRHAEHHNCKYPRESDAF